MKTLLTFALFAGALILGCGAASTSVASFRDPDFVNVRFKRILVVAEVSNLDRKLYFESTMSSMLRELGLFAVEGYVLFPPTREFSPEQKLALLLRDSVDAYLSVSVGEVGIRETYIPPTGSITRGKAKSTLKGVEYQETTTNVGGYTVSKPWATFRSKLVDMASGNTAWIATASTGGNAFADFRTVFASFSRATISRLRSDKLLFVESQNQPPSSLDGGSEHTPSIIYFTNGTVLKTVIVGRRSNGMNPLAVLVKDPNGVVTMYDMVDILRIESDKTPTHN